LSTSSPIRARIAPTPSGYVHVGNVFNFILTALLTRKNKGFLHLRIDDIDALRSRKEYVEDIFYVLDWLNLSYDEGPSGPTDFYQNYSQQLRLGEYQKRLKLLWEQEMAFACKCSRTQIRETSVDGQYPGNCRELKIPLGEVATAVRIRTPKEKVVSWKDEYMGAQFVTLYEAMRDFVIGRKDGMPAYQLVSLIEDLDHEINFIIRGMDLVPSTAAQLFLAQQMNETRFQQARFLHHPLFYETSGQKLSKSAGATSMQQLIQQWKEPTACYQWMASSLNLGSHDIFDFSDLLEALNIEQLRIRIVAPKPGLSPF